MIEFHNPEAEVATQSFPYELSVPIRGQDVHVGLLANGFPDSEAFLGHLAEAIGQQQPSLKLSRVNKGNPSIPASEAMLADLKDRCGAVIAAYGH